ncbi:hypothetical protein [Treponema porcinum]|uniref:hypothetical protein n=1 Tax=Treponema porcinum TaxID=261392 RepID=UPI0023525DBC|nr:hypothetical protein [Treponema porcinum]MCI6721487.1 hypothetical protein [Treponema porcinum]
MSLFSELQKASSEEDVKDAYIKALHLKSYQKNLIDIQTKEVWFEAKVGCKVSTYAMFTQLCFYVAQALKEGEEIPPFLCVIDSVKAAIMETQTVYSLLNDKSVKIKWGKSASDVTQEALEVVSQYIGTHFVSFRIETQEKEFIDTVQKAIATGEIIRTQITPDNLKQVFDRWVEMIGREIKGIEPENYCLLFFADIMSDGTVSTHENLPAELLHRNNRPTFLLDGKLYELGNYDGYRKFWAIYNRPPEAEYRNYLLERRDSLIPTDERSFKGAYFTPLHVVEKAYELLNRTLGKNWQRDYIVWDMCCGVGNLETKHSNHRNIFMSTLDQADVDVMKAAKTCRAATRFQYDYLNDDITDDGKIDYSLTEKIPQNLRTAIAEAKAGKDAAGKPAKKILVLINPPYAESGEGINKGNKEKVAKTKFARTAMKEYGKATNELFTQFIARIAEEIPNATIAMFSTLKYVNATNFQDFRKKWNVSFLDGFIVHSKAFDGINGNFPIGFLIWKTYKENKEFPVEISCEVLDKDAKPIGQKSFYNLSSENFLSKWIKRASVNEEEVIALKNAVTEAGTGKWSDNAIAHFLCDSNDLQNAGQATAIFSSTVKIGHKGTCFVTPENLWQVAIVFSVRQLIPHTWINHNDQFLKPTSELSDEFKSDCLVWMLFNGKNLTAGADNLVWDNREWSITNHFIPYTEDEVNAPDRFESDFMVRYIEKLPHLSGTDSPFSFEARAVLEEGKKLWRAYFSATDERTVRDKYKLNRSDAGWYQIRGALKSRSESGDFPPVSFTAFETAYRTLTEKLRPLVYKYSFLR